MTHQPKPLLSIAARIGVALAVVGLVSAASAAAGHESEQAVQIATAAIHAPAHVTLPTVTIIARRATSGAQAL